MRTTIDLPDDLLDEVRKISGLKTKRDAVCFALQEYVRHAQLEKLLSMFGKIDMTLTADELEDIRELDMPHHEIQITDKVSTPGKPVRKATGS